MVDLSSSLCNSLPEGKLLQNYGTSPFIDSSDFFHEQMMIFHSFLYVYQRVLIRTVDDYRIFFNYNVSILTNKHIDV